MNGMPGAGVCVCGSRSLFSLAGQHAHHASYAGSVRCARSAKSAAGKWRAMVDHGSRRSCRVVEYVETQDIRKVCKRTAPPSSPLRVNVGGVVCGR